MKDKELIEQYNHDFTEDEVITLDNWVMNNKPGIHSLTDTKIAEWFNLYMSGKTYTEISQISKSKKDLILFVSKRQRWFDKKNDYFKDISTNVVQKYKEAKIETVNTMATMVSAMNQYFNRKFNKYLSFKDDKILESIDTKMLSQYSKITESLDKVMSDLTGEVKTDSKNTPINININNSSVKKIDENSIDIETKSDEDDEVKDILASLSRLKKIREKEE